MLVRLYFSVTGFRALSFALAAAFLALVAVAMPTGAFGRFSLALSVVQVVGSGILSFGNLALLRFAREEYKETGKVGEALGVRLSLHVVILVIVLPAVWLAFPSLTQGIGLNSDALPFLLLGFVVLSIHEMGVFCAQAVERFAGYGLAPVAFRVTQLVTLALMLLAAASSWWILMLGTIAGYAAGALVSWSRVPARALRAIRPTSMMARRFVAYSWSTPFATVSVMLVSWMDLWFLERFHGVGAVGVYAWAYSICLLTTALVTPLGALLAPRLIDLHVSGDRPGMDRLMALTKSLFVAAVVLAPLAVGAFGFAGNLIGLGAYAGAVAPAMILIAAVTFQLGINLWYQTVLADEDLIAGATAVLVAGGLVNALGDWLLVPALGGIGAALATTLSFAVTMAGLLWLVERRIGRTPGPGLARLMGFFGVMLAPVVIAAYLAPAGALVLCFSTTAVLVLAGRRLGFFEGFAPARERLATLRGRTPALTLRAVTWLTSRS